MKTRRWHGLAVLAACVAMCSACGGNGTVEGSSVFDLRLAVVVDLTYPYDEATLYWPTAETTFELSSVAHGFTEGGYFYSANAFCTPEHGGTHVDAPIHFAENGWTLADVPIRRLIAPGVVIDVGEAAARDPDYRLTVADVHAWEATHGPIPAGAIVLLRTGWSERWPDALRYLGDDTPGRASHLHFPGYGAEATRLLVEERGISAIGIDTASVDHGPSTDFVVHQVAAAANVVAFENVANLDRLPPVGSWIVALPMKIADGSGGPVRIVGLLAPASAGSATG